MGRGDYPAPILFIGEAPGKSEDVLGKAFVGKSGKLLDDIIQEAWQAVVSENYYPNEARVPLPNIYITNTVGCRPSDKLGGENREPTEEEVLACIPRMEHIITCVKPVVVIFIGKFAFKYYRKRFPEHFHIYHPSYLLRGGGKAHPEYGITVRKLAEAFKYYDDNFNRG